MAYNHCYLNSALLIFPRMIKIVYIGYKLKVLTSTIRSLRCNMQVHNVYCILSWLVPPTDILLST